MERRLYKVGLSVNFNSEVKLERNYRKLVEAAEGFSEESNYKKVLSIASLENNMIYFLIAFNSSKGYEKFTLKSVVGFLRKVCATFGLQYNSSKNYFAIEDCILLTQDEYVELLKEANINAGAMMLESNEQDEAVDTNSEEDILEKEDNIDEKTDFKIPKRKFPILISGNPRLSGNDKKEDTEKTTLKDSLEQLDNLIGINEVKEQIKQITSFIIRNNERYADLNIDNPGLFYNTVISGGKGTGKSTIAKILFNIYLELGVIGKGKLIIVDSKDIWPGCSLDRQIGNAQSGVILINDAHLISTNDKRGPKDNFTTLDEWFSKYKDNFVFILVGETEGVAELLKNDRVRNHMDFLLNISDFSETHTLELIRHFAAREKYSVHENAEEVILKYISKLKEKKMFENAYTARRIIEKAIVKNGVKDNSNCLCKEDFHIEIEEIKKEPAAEDQSDPFKELEGMIGLCEVKEKVKEIAAYAEAQMRRKKLGLKSQPLCLHMNFTGNPGTGKTTVARCIGRILNKIGVLSTGKFVEAAREDLVGKYVGHTAAKTADKIKEAEGGVLFIDEAYSLDSDSKVDYGYEAVNTLVKKMEDLRDNLVVIFAGYPREMAKFIKMNPGLKDRIQFKLEFTDYKPEDLLSIWQKFFIDNEYKVEDDALEEMKAIAEKLYENRNSSFSNGRIMRKCFERVKMHQAVRVINEGIEETDELIKVTSEDLKRLYEEKDIAEMLQEITLKKCIGFAR